MLRSWFNIIAILVCSTLTGLLLFFLWRISDGTEFRRVERDTIQFTPLPVNPPSAPETNAPPPLQNANPNSPVETPAPGDAMGKPEANQSTPE